MTTLLRRIAAALLASAAIALPARATSYSVDYTDMWWNASESGWGLNVIQQSDVLFLTFFVYGPDGTPRWYVGSLVTPAPVQPVDGARFTGPLYGTTGPWFGGAFDPAAVGATEVGTVTLTFDSPATGTLSYTVGGVPVVKVVERYSYRVNSVGGSYAGGLVALASQCSDANANGPTDLLGTTVVTQTSAQVTFKVTFSTPAGLPATCTFTGDYVQKGRMASVPAGSFACIVDGFQANAGVFSMSALDAQLNGFHATFSGRDQFCTYNGRFGGTRDVAG